MVGRGRRFHRHQPKKDQEKPVSLAGDSPVLNVFLKAARFLTDRQDRHERVVKLSRDVTIESKRIIFLLHSPVTLEKSRDQIIAEAKERLTKLRNGAIKSIAYELEHAPQYLHNKAYSPGMQEFVEAYTLCYLMENKTIIPIEEIRAELIFNVKPKNGNDRAIATMLTPSDYMLGLADLTGELMRKTINEIMSQDVQETVFACDILRSMYAGYLGLINAGGPVSSKMNTVRMNLYKVEHALFSYKVRRSEVIRTVPLALQPDPLWDATSDDDGCF